MAPVFNFNRTTKENQLFFLNTIQIPGVQSINGSYTNTAIPLTFMGASSIKMASNGLQIGTISVNYLLIGTDQFISYTGVQGFNGYIVNSQSNTTKNYSFTSGYLSSYGSRCTIGEIPQIGVGINIYGNQGQLTSQESSSVSSHFNTISTAVSDLRLMIPGPGSITLGINDFNTNAVQSYNLNINVGRNPVYILGTNNPYSIETIYPMEVFADFTILLNDYTPKKLKDYPFNSTTQNLNLTIKDYNTSDTIINYSFSNMILTSENYTATVSDKGTEVNMQYKTYLTR